MDDLRRSPQEHPAVSPRWLLGAAGVVLACAAACAWLLLCLLYWQGSWQLLYHPKTAVLRTPAGVGLAYEPVRFAATETGETRLTGWWIPAAGARFTVLYLHGVDGNLGDCVETVAALHREGLAVFAFDYRGYGGSEAARPGETRMIGDAALALDWLTQTRHVPSAAIVAVGTGVGADLAAELAAEHAELAGVILDQPVPDPMAAVFNDPRSRLVPAHWLVRDRYDLKAAASHLRIPSLWLLAQPQKGQAAEEPPAFEASGGRKAAVWLSRPAAMDPNFKEALGRWMDDLR